MNCGLGFSFLSFREAEEKQTLRFSPLEITIYGQTIKDFDLNFEENTQVIMREKTPNVCSLVVQILCFLGRCSASLARRSTGKGQRSCAVIAEK